jgi:hypothetical protein
MVLIHLLQTRTGRIMRVVVGFLLLAYGSRSLTFPGVVAMMAGVMSLVTGAAGLPAPPPDHTRHI